jgi:hypothetical protein
MSSKFTLEKIRKYIAVAKGGRQLKFESDRANYQSYGDAYRKQDQTVSPEGGVS